MTDSPTSQAMHLAMTELEYRSERIAQLSEELAKERARLDWLELERADARKRGFQWNTWAYDALQSELTIREQIDEAIRRWIPHA